MYATDGTKCLISSTDASIGHPQGLAEVTLARAAHVAQFVERGIRTRERPSGPSGNRAFQVPRQERLHAYVGIGSGCRLVPDGRAVSARFGGVLDVGQHRERLPFHVEVVVGA